MNIATQARLPAARQSGRAIPMATFHQDAAALAARLPVHKYVVNLCTDRYRFATGLAAALAAGQISLMPSSSLPAALTALAEDYPDLYALTDGAETDLPSLAYPADLTGPAAPFTLDEVADDQQAVILFTSGSTGRPQPMAKDWGTLRRSALAAGARLGIGALRGASIIGTVPHHHSYGLESVILLGLLHGLTIDAGWPLYPADIRAALARAPRPRILVTTPVHLRALLAAPEGMPAADLILSATAPLPVELAGAAEACFGGTLVEIYGCTEAGQIATRRSAHETAWRCFDGITLHQDGATTWADGPAVPGPTLLHDQITLTGPQTFHLGGRAADLVDVAGKRASLASLTHQLLSIPGVQDGVFLMGEARGAGVPRLAAVAVAPGLDARAIMAELRQRIDPAFLPRPLVLVDSLPRNALGKLPRETLLRLIGQPARDGGG
ncbi:AMP-binding protein [Acidocella sp.]|uniref:AMP-binding protein n=1 Tax=Acidocella sp. TaxID=50710 RepID=UPI002620BC28|nr:AMP-binding protein [Acidocella sp.]